MYRLRSEDERGEFPVVDGTHEREDRQHAEDRAVRMACNEPNVRYLVRDARNKEVFSATLKISRTDAAAGAG